MASDEGGIVGRFMGGFGITMSFAIFISVIVASTITPMLCSRWLRVPKGGDVVVPKHGLDEHAPGVYERIEWFYIRRLDGRAETTGEPRQR
ncbi:MAG: efflux RND transporter permease subunit [Vicinamibacteria bacterium]